MNKKNVPSSNEERDQLRHGLRAEILDDDLNLAVGGKGDMKGKGSMIWTCPYCGQVVSFQSTQDTAKHIAQDCPNNPFK